MVLFLLGAWPLGKWIGRKTANTPMGRFVRDSMNYPNYYGDPRWFHKTRNVVMTAIGLGRGTAREWIFNWDEFIAFHGDKVLDKFVYTPPEPWEQLYADRNWGDTFHGIDSEEVDRILKYK